MMSLYRPHISVKLNKFVRVIGLLGSFVFLHNVLIGVSVLIGLNDATTTWTTERYIIVIVGNLLLLLFLLPPCLLGGYPKWILLLVPENLLKSVKARVVWRWSVRDADG